MTSLVHDIPYADYFRVESRWVFSTTLQENRCRMQVGVKVAWIKSTWLKKQVSVDV
jgi:hypothetical protein